jgi:hypothetical protein
MMRQAPQLASLEHQAADERLTDELRASLPERFLATTNVGEQTFANELVAAHARPTYTADELEQFEDYLDQEGVFAVPLTWGEITVEGAKQSLPFVAATETSANHGDMSSMIYLRDHIQVARAYMEMATLDPERYKTQGLLGKQLIQSALHAMSTETQLGRFEKLIEKGSAAGQEDWPFISLHLGDLDAVEPNGWRNMQDSWQMLTHLTLDAFERGFMNLDDITESNRQFLGYVTPALEAVGFPKHESSGTWEEVIAIRTSVMAVETALFHKMHQLLTGPQADQYRFLSDNYAAHRRVGTQANLVDQLADMRLAGLTELGQRLPFESPDYDKSSVKYREADAALSYLLTYDIPELLEEFDIPIACLGGHAASARIIEDVVLQQLYSLMDPETGGMKRYRRDSYLGVNFLTNTVQASITAIKNFIAKEALERGTRPDLDKKQRLRNGIVNSGASHGTEAAWAHPVAYTGAEMARRRLRVAQEQQPAEAADYQRHNEHFLNQLVRTITGSRQPTLARQASGKSGVEIVSEHKVPEAWVRVRDALGVMLVPSPHSPLNWAAANTALMFAYSRAAARAAEAIDNGQQVAATLANRELGKLGLTAA